MSRLRTFQLLQKQLPLDFNSPERLAELQLVKLKRLLKFAYQNSTFYRRRFEQLGAVPADITSFEKFALFPELTRAEILENIDQILTYPKTQLKSGRTGGSTGHPLTYYFLKEDKYLISAARKRVETWIEADCFKPKLTLWGITGSTNVPDDISWQFRLKTKHYHYSFDYIDQPGLERLARDFAVIKPPKVYGYVSLLTALAEFILENGIKLPHPPKVIIATAETLTEEDRSIIEAGLGGPVYNLYGSHENGFIAAECKLRQGLHVLADHVHLEIRDETLFGSEPVGNIILTDLDNLAMPFIRYRNADLGAWSRGKCGCGRKLPLLKGIFGRTTDCLYDQAGTAYLGINIMRILRPVAAAGHINQFQLIQHLQGELELRAVPGPNLQLEQDEVRLQKVFKEYFKGLMKLKVDWVQQIQAGATVETPFIKSYLVNQKDYKQ